MLLSLFCCFHAQDTHLGVNARLAQAQQWQQQLVLLWREQWP
jgi:hypothetical protein